jgi:hypothetical protein
VTIFCFFNFDLRFACIYFFINHFVSGQLRHESSRKSRLCGNCTDAMNIAGGMLLRIAGKKRYFVKATPVRDFCRNSENNICFQRMRPGVSKPD